MQLEGLVSGFRNPCFFSLRSVERKLHVRQDERLRERTRIAEQLHGTVLKGFRGATEQLQTALDLVPANSAAKLSLSRVLALMERVVEDMRRSLGGLRTPDTNLNDLAEAFARVPHELGIKSEFEFRIVVLGSPRGLQAGIYEGTYHIGREAMVNAFRHSGGSSIVVELEYGPKRFVLRVRDNGCGIDPEIIRSGREGHWGLVGMRERSESIGATLRVRSRVAAGTELELSIPNRVAFASRCRDPEKECPAKESGPES